MSTTTKTRRRTKTDPNFADRAFAYALRDKRRLRLEFIEMFAAGRIELSDYLRMSDMFGM